LACSITIQEASAASIIVITGDADLNSADLLRAAIEKARSGGQRIVIDLTGATLIDSRTIGVLAGCAQAQRSRGSTMPIVCEDPNILRLFSTIGLEREFDFFPTHEAALAA